VSFGLLYFGLSFIETQINLLCDWSTQQLEAPGRIEEESHDLVKSTAAMPAYAV
jgi:hypothetical protein